MISSDRFEGSAVRLAAIALSIAAWLGLGLLPAPATALVFASPDTEPEEVWPADFPYWDHITQRRYEGPSVIYLGAGYAMTARHVGMGEIAIAGEIIEPVPGSKRTLLNANGSAADAMVFELDSRPSIQALPLLPIASEPPQAGEEILLIGFGKVREKVIEFEVDGREHFGFSWSKKGQKRWGTNRIDSQFEVITQGQYQTRAFAFDFDAPFTSESTRFEAQAAMGDSGGAVFVERDGEWQLVGMMISISGQSPRTEISAIYGDITYAVDLTHYRGQVLRWTRPACANGLDDDGDDWIDYPADPGCDQALDRNERDTPLLGGARMQIILGASGALLAIALGLTLRRQRGTSTPSSTRPSSAA